MDNDKMGRHIYGKFDAELEDIRTKVLSLGGVVERQLDLAMMAFGANDFKSAEQSIKLINQAYTLKNSLDLECVTLLALRQPAAFDLRLLVTIIKIIYELELIAELAETIAKMAIQLATLDSKPGIYPEIQELYESVKALLHHALDAFARIEINNITATLSDVDKDIEREYAGISQLLTAQMMVDPKNITRILYILRVARALERIGDHAFHIVEELIYMVNGERTMSRVFKVNDPMAG